MRAYRKEGAGAIGRECGGRCEDFKIRLGRPGKQGPERDHEFPGLGGRVSRPTLESLRDLRALRARYGLMPAA